MSEAQKPPYPLRISNELRDKLQESARLHGRSLNAEITLRLEQSFENGSAEPVAAPELQRYYILLDSSGYPISWSEVMAHVRGFSNTSGVDPIDLKVEVITPDMESNSRRAEEAAKLAAYYRKLGKSAKITKSQE